MKINFKIRSATEAPTSEEPKQLDRISDEQAPSYVVKMLGMKPATRLFMPGDVIEARSYVPGANVQNKNKISVLWKRGDDLVSHVLVEDGQTVQRPYTELFDENISARTSEVIGHVQKPMRMEFEGQYALEHRDLVKAYFAAQER